MNRTPRRRVRRKVEVVPELPDNTEFANLCKTWRIAALIAKARADTAARAEAAKEMQRNAQAKALAEQVARNQVNSEDIRRKFAELRSELVGIADGAP